jgi:hypothetical protein
VARALMLSGAVEVAGLALARQPWGPRAAAAPEPRPANARPAPA